MYIPSLKKEVVKIVRDMGIQIQNEKVIKSPYYIKNEEKSNPKLSQKHCCQNRQNRTTNWGLTNPARVGKRGASVKHQGKRAGGGRTREGCVKLEKK